MERFMGKPAAVAIAVLAMAASAQAWAESPAACISEDAAKSRMKGSEVTYDSLSPAQVGALAARFAANYQNPSQALRDADSALVFHRPNAQHLAWVVLFKDGCALAEGPIEERIYSEVGARKPD
jgi:hypothetical protein